jgi:hypothetical protein
MRTRSQRELGIFSSAADLSSQFEAIADLARQQAFHSLPETVTETAAEVYFTPDSIADSAASPQGSLPFPSPAAPATASPGTPGSASTYRPAAADGGFTMDELAVFLRDKLGGDSKKFTGSSDTDVFEFIDRNRQKAVTLSAKATAAAASPKQ